jgi:hypothetical protein
VSISRQGGLGHELILYFTRPIADEAGPVVARAFYEALFSSKDSTLNMDAVAYAFDDAVWELRKINISPSRWAPFVHFGM